MHVEQTNGASKGKITCSELIPFIL